MMPPTPPQTPLSFAQLRELAHQFVKTAFAGGNPAYTAAHADGCTRGLLVMQIDAWRILPDGQVAVRVTPGFEPLATIPTLLGGRIEGVERLLEQVRTYDPDESIVVLILTPIQARSFCIGRRPLTSAA